MRVKLFILFLLTISTFLYSQELSFRVVEKKGKVDIKVRDGEWTSVKEGDILVSGTEIYTGLHSHISLEVENSSFITLKQLSHLTIETVRLKKNEINTEFFLYNGYLVAISKKIGELKNRILVSFEEGSAQFDNSGGEIYLRSDMGAVIKSFLGRVKVVSNVKNRYFISKGEVCGITNFGKLVESAYFLNRDSHTVPFEYGGEDEILAYYRLLINSYTDNKDSNDYGEAFGVD